MKNKTIGIPRSLFYYKYRYLLTSFFKELKVNILISPQTDEDIFKKGKNIVNNKLCIPLQIFIGHVNYLKDKSDYILIIRMKEDCICYNSLYDLINNLFNINILDLYISDETTEEDSFIKIGLELGFSKQYVLNAYKQAKKYEYKQRKINYLLEHKKIEKDSKKVLIVSEDYIYNDQYIKNDFMKLNKYKNIDFFYSNTINPDIKPYKKAILYNANSVKKIVNKTIYISTYPCVYKKTTFFDKSLTLEDINLEKTIYECINNGENNND